MKIRFWDTGNFSKRTRKNYTMHKVIAEIGSFALGSIPMVEKTTALRPRSKTNKVIVEYFEELFNINGVS